MVKELTYSEAGVDRKLRAQSKTALRMLKQTYRFSSYGKVVQLPYGNIFSIGNDRYLDLTIEGIGTKVLLAQLADKYDTIGVDAVAMAVNDVIRSGARPLALADNIHAQLSDPHLVQEWMKGLTKGAIESRCIIAGGEIGDVAEIIKGYREGKGFDMVVACIGEVHRSDVIFGNDIEPREDVVIGLRSSGIHSNGVTLARKVLFKQWGGKFDPYDVLEGLDKELVYEVLEPTKIYAKPLADVARRFRIKGAVHITGDAYLKFGNLMKFSRGTGFELTNFKPQPIFTLIQSTARKMGSTITDGEMLKTFNMGWGFVLIVKRRNLDGVVGLLEKNGVEAEVIGKATSTGKIVAVYNGKKLVLQ
ncbi:MAG: phosphoribosylformylglycinamidine cyclo-ligase [Candidatus Bathyarchaeia archaeon]